MVCPYCNAENRDGAMFCTHCGRELSEAAQEAPAPPQYEPTEPAQQPYEQPPPAQQPALQKALQAPHMFIAM